MNVSFVGFGKTMHAYARLMRLHKPVGILLLWAPTAWALWLANGGHPPMALLIYFFLGTVFMRSAGCVINDMADRHIDVQVTRTRGRPLASCELSMRNAQGLVVVLLVGSLGILLQLPAGCWIEGFIALVITLIYPFGKRIIQAPQVLLGLAFSMGIPMAYTASHRALNGDMFILFGLNFLWILAYDTVYAMADRPDDLRIGVRSTAIAWGVHVYLVLGILEVLVQCLWLILAQRNALSGRFYLGWSLASLLLAVQYYWMIQPTSKDYIRLFSWHAAYGLMMWMALL